MPLTTKTNAPLSIGRPSNANSEPTEVQSPEKVNNSSIGVGGSDVEARPVLTSPGSNADGAMPLPVLGRREARRLEWQRLAQLTRSKDVRVEMFTDCKPSKALVFLPERLVWYLRARILFLRPAEGKLVGEREARRLEWQRQAQLAPSKDLRVGVFTDYKPSTALVVLPDRLV